MGSMEYLESLIDISSQYVLTAVLTKDSLLWKLSVFLYSDLTHRRNLMTVKRTPASVYTLCPTSFLMDHQFVYIF
jgi:hypothetical protein